MLCRWRYSARPDAAAPGLPEGYPPGAVAPGPSRGPPAGGSEAIQERMNKGLQLADCL